MVVICGPSFTKSLQYFFNEIKYKFFASVIKNCRAARMISSFSILLDIFAMKYDLSYYRMFIKKL